MSNKQTDTLKKVAYESLASMSGHPEPDGFELFMILAACGSALLAVWCYVQAVGAW